MARHGLIRWGLVTARWPNISWLMGPIITASTLLRAQLPWRAHRLQLLDRKGKVKQGSVLECPFDSAIFDWVVSIGCLHHTGDMERGIKELYRVLKPGGIGAGLFAR